MCSQPFLCNVLRRYDIHIEYPEVVVPEYASVPVVVMASPELLAQMEGQQTPPVSIKATRNPNGTWEFWFTQYFTAEALVKAWEETRPTINKDQEDMRA